MAAKAIKHPVKTAKKVQQFGKSMYESYQNLKDIHNIVGIPGLAQMYQGYRKAYKWAKANPHKDLTPVRPSAQMLKTQAHDPGKGHVVDAVDMRAFNKERAMRELGVDNLNFGDRVRPKGFVGIEDKAAHSRGYVEFNKRELMEMAENKELVTTAAHEISHASQGPRFGVEGAIVTKTWVDSGLAPGKDIFAGARKKLTKELGVPEGKVSNWKNELFDMLRPTYKKWHRSKFEEKSVINRPDGSYSVTYPEKQRIGEFPQYLLGGDNTVGLDPKRFGMEIQSRMAELRTILNIKNRDISKQEVVKRIKDALNHPKGHRLKTIGTEFKSLFQGESFGAMVSKLNYMLPGLAPVGMIDSLAETDDEFIEELSKFGEE